MTRNEYDIEMCWDEETNEFDWDEYQYLCDIADYWSCEEQKGEQMTFIAHVTYWAEFINDCKGGYRNVSCFLIAENLPEATNYICDYYGEEFVEKLTLEVFSPDQMLEFDDANIEESAVFNEIITQLNPKVVW